MKTDCNLEQYPLGEIKKKKYPLFREIIIIIKNLQRLVQQRTKINQLFFLGQMKP